MKAEANEKLVQTLEFFLQETWIAEEVTNMILHPDYQTDDVIAHIKAYTDRGNQTDEYFKDDNSHSIESFHDNNIGF